MVLPSEGFQTPIRRSSSKLYTMAFAPYGLSAAGTHSLRVRSFLRYRYANGLVMHAS
jgi:hypothetical protein